MEGFVFEVLINQHENKELSSYTLFVASLIENINLKH